MSSCKGLHFILCYIPEYDIVVVATIWMANCVQFFKYSKQADLPFRYHQPYKFPSNFFLFVWLYHVSNLLILSIETQCIWATVQVKSIYTFESHKTYLGTTTFPNTRQRWWQSKPILKPISSFKSRCATLLASLVERNLTQ